MSTTDPATEMTRTHHSHWCMNAHRMKGQAPTAACVEGGGPVSCGTEVWTVRQVRRFKNRPGQVRVTWSGGGMTWETDPR